MEDKGEGRDLVTMLKVVKGLEMVDNEDLTNNSGRSRPHRYSLQQTRCDNVKKSSCSY